MGTPLPLRRLATAISPPPCSRLPRPAAHANAQDEGHSSIRLCVWRGDIPPGTLNAPHNKHNAALLTPGLERVSFSTACLIQETTFQSGRFVFGEHAHE